MLNTQNFINLTNKELEQPIYRIMKQEYVFSLFSKNENILSQPRNWKDKFENFQLNMGGLIDGKRFFYEFRDEFVAQCWTSHGISEAMWGIYANNPNEKYLRIRSTPKKLLTAMNSAHPSMPQTTCFIGKVVYKKETDIRAALENDGVLELTPERFIKLLLLKRKAFKHEREIRLIYSDKNTDIDKNGLYRYYVDPNEMITQIMADPNRSRTTWKSDKEEIKEKTGFRGNIKRSKVYDPPNWKLPSYKEAITF